MSEFQIPREDFIAVRRSPPTLEHEIIIAVKKPNLDIIEKTLLARATPGNSNYQQWFSLEEIDELVNGTKESANEVLKWCRSHKELRVHSLSRRLDFIVVRAPVAKWEELLDTKFYAYEDRSHFLAEVEDEDEEDSEHDDTNQHYSRVEVENSMKDSSLLFKRVDEMEGQSSSKLLLRSLFSTIHDDTIINNTNEKKQKKAKKRVAPIVHRAEYYTIPLPLQSHILGMVNTVQTPPRYQPNQHGFKIKDKQTLIELQRKRRAHIESALSSSPSVKSRKLRREAENRNSLHIRMLDENPATVTIPFLNDLYKVPSNLGDLNLKQSVFQTNKEHYSTEDLEAFQSYFNLTVQPATPKNGHAVPTCPAGGFNSTMSCKEGNLDTQYIMGMAQNTTTVFWWVPVRPLIDPFAAWAVAVANDTQPPMSNSISWGSMEFLQSPLMMTLFNIEALLLSAIGATIIVSSGDDGAPNFLAAGSRNGLITQDTCLCRYDSGSYQLPWQNSLTESFSGEGYFPNFPASSPYVTTVGATMGPEVSLTAETVAAQSQAGGVITSGGGFSVYFPTPSWQQATVSTYLANHAPTKTGYNRKGRAYPDLSLIGVDYAVMMNKELVAFYGTSCVAPVLAGWVSLVNAERRQRGLNTTVGWMNPTLYAVGENYTQNLPNIFQATFHDVSSGHNRCCHISGSTSSPTCCESGYTATCGWDPVTGWGSIDYPNFASIFLPEPLSSAEARAQSLNYSCPIRVTDVDLSNDDSSPSVASIIVLTTAVLLLIALFMSMCGYIITICRATRNGWSRVHIDQQSSNIIPVAVATTATVVSPSSGQDSDVQYGRYHTISNNQNDSYGDNNSQVPVVVATIADGSSNNHNNLGSTTAALTMHNLQRHNSLPYPENLGAGAVEEIEMVPTVTATAIPLHAAGSVVMPLSSSSSSTAMVVGTLSTSAPMMMMVPTADVLLSPTMTRNTTGNSMSSSSRQVGLRAPSQQVYSALPSYH